MISQDLIRQARQTDLVTYLQSRGEPLKPVGRNYVHKQHDSLYIKDNMFTWYSRQAQGNSVDFLMLFYGLTFQQAVEALTEADLTTVQKPLQTQVQERTQATDERQVIAYLCKKRAIQSDIVLHLIKNGKLKQDNQGNCNFIITDWNGNSIGAEIVGTGDTRYKQITTHSGYGFNIQCGEQPTDALYFESAIDLLSCYQLFKSKFTHHILVSMGGLNNSLIYELKRKKPDIKHWLCVDNDSAGDNFISEMKKMLSVQVFRPIKEHKDWNEQLKAIAGQEKKKIIKGGYFMSVKDYAVSVLSTLPEKKLKEFVLLFADENTIARMESDLLANDPNSKRYSDFEEFMQEMENEEDDE